MLKGCSSVSVMILHIFSSFFLLEAPPTGTFLADQEIERPVAGYERERKKKEVEENCRRSGLRPWFEECRVLKKKILDRKSG